MLFLVRGLVCLPQAGRHFLDRKTRIERWHSQDADVRDRAATKGKEAFCFY